MSEKVITLSMGKPLYGKNQFTESRSLGVERKSGGNLHP